MKDHPNFLNAAALLVREGKQFRFVCVGDGPIGYRASLQELSMILGLDEHMIWVSARADVSDIYSALDLLVSSSSFGEGFSNVIGEAMACGVPCVATDVGDSGLVIRELGKIVTAKDPVALKTGMQQVLDRKPCSAEIRRRIAEHFSLENLVLATERTLLALCHQPAGKPVPAGHNRPVG
jgi:glycosyltransferase involved in cell wall biosynthesis